MSAEETKPGHSTVNAQRSFTVDRDDDSGSPFVDRDYPEGDVPLPAVFQEDDSGESDVDYAGFTADSDDPFADSEAPKGDAPSEPSSSDAAAATVARAPSEDRGPDAGSELLAAAVAAASKDVHEHSIRGNLAFPDTDYADRENDQGDAGTVSSDSGVSEMSGQDMSTALLQRGNGRHDRNEVPDSSGDDDEAGFVDDFLNDLDTPQSALSEPRIRNPQHDRTVSADRIGRVSTVHAAGVDIDDRMAPKEHARSNAAPFTDSGHTGGSRRKLPLTMIALVIAALALLAIGAYGVLQQRTQLQSDIRELRSRLATTASREEMDQERRLQQRTQGDNEALRAELAGLQSANSALSDELARLDAEMDEREAVAQAVELAAQRASSAQRVELEAALAAQAQADMDVDRGTAIDGAWFVNFGSYAQRAMAERWAAKLSVDDGEVAVLAATAAGKPLYRVRVVGLADKGTAERVAAALEKQHALPRLWVGRRESGPGT